MWTNSSFPDLRLGEVSLKAFLSNHVLLRAAVRTVIVQCSAERNPKSLSVDGEAHSQAPTVLLGPMSPLHPTYSTLAGPHNARGVKLENVWKLVAFIS